MEQAIAALEARGKTGLLFSAMIDHPLRFAYWQGHLEALRSLRCGAGEALARKDAALGAYDVPARLQGAWAALPVNIKKATLAEVQQLLTAHGVEVARDPIAQREIDAVLQLKNRELPVVALNDEHAVAAVDVNDASGEHF